MRRRRHSRYSKSRIHFIAQCQDCDWGSEDYIDGPKEASRHAAKTGHFIVGDVGYCFKYKRKVGQRTVARVYKKGGKK